ncbi:MAG: hypothetical protein N3H31_00045 [Candidatus Nezhaarchaeota archaeon]|nr:hypothetical protein [Candidatus Nezhaarchaeota archaeon]
MVDDLPVELEKTLKAYSDFLNKLFSVSTYFRGLTWDEFRDSLAVSLVVLAKTWQLSNEYWYESLRRLLAIDLDGALSVYLEYLSRLEDVAAEVANTPLYAAYVNAVNKFYINCLTLLQNVDSAILHALGLATRRDIVALGEAYVDLKSDLKREFRGVREGVAKLREAIDELRKEVTVLKGVR